MKNMMVISKKNLFSKRLQSAHNNITDMSNAADTKAEGNVHDEIRSGIVDAVDLRNYSEDDIKVPM